MKLLNKQLLRDFTERYADARSQIGSWEAEVENAEWKTPHELKARYSKVSFLGDQETIFNICGNKYRLYALVNYKNGIVLVKKIGTHDEYDKWNLD